jgi:hypothetical protein
MSKQQQQQDVYAEWYRQRQACKNVRAISLSETNLVADDGIISWYSQDSTKQDDNNYHQFGYSLIPLKCRAHAALAKPTLIGCGANTGQGKAISWTEITWNPALVSMFSYSYVQFCNSDI